MFNRLALWLADHSRGLALLALLSLVYPLSLLPRLRLDNSVEVWFSSAGTAYQAYLDFLAKYGSEEFVIVASAADDPLDAPTLSLQRGLARDLETLDHVAGVLSLGPLADAVAQVHPDGAAALRQAPFVRHLLLGADDHAFGLLVRLQTFDAPAQRRQTVEAIEAVVARHATAAHRFHLAGTPIMNAALDRGSQRAAQTFLPLALTVSALLLWRVLRRWYALATVLVAVSFTTVWTMGLMVLAGKSLNMVTIVLPSLLFVLSLSSGIHVATRFLTLRSMAANADLVLRQTLLEVTRPVCLSNLTTAVGFAVLRLSDMQPVVDFGSFAAWGMGISLIANLIIVPGLMQRWPAQPQRPRPMTHWTATGAAWAARHPRPVLVTTGILLILGTVLAVNVTVDSNVLSFFPRQAPIRQDYDFVRERLTGLYTVELDASTAKENTPALLKALEACADSLADHENVAKVLHYGSPVQFLKSLSGSVLMDTPRARHSALRDMQQQFRHRDGDTQSLRLSILTTAMAGSQFDTLVRDIKRVAGTTIAPVGTYRLTGVVPLLIRAQQSLIVTQLRTLGAALAVVLVLIGLFLGSIKALIAAVLPNLLPVVGLFVIMVFAGIALDTATVMIAGVALGIAADDTVHFLSHYRQDRRIRHDAPAAVRACFDRIGQPITFTTLVAVAGFALLLGAPFKPIQYFGLLGSVAMVLAWIGDIFVLPACVTALRLWPRWGDIT